MAIIYWREVDAGRLQANCKPTAIFARRGYWLAKNSNDETSRDRYRGLNLHAQIRALEGKLAAFGYGAQYCASIRSKVTGSLDDAHSQHLYLAALTRTLHSKSRCLAAVADPS